MEDRRRSRSGFGIPSADGLSVDLTTGPLETGRVYRVRAAGVRSAEGERLVPPEGAYTLNEIPAR